MKKTNLMSLFISKLSKLKDVQYINNGGCGIAALAIYKWLIKNVHDIKCSFVYEYDKWDSHMYESNKRALNLNNNSSINKTKPKIYVPSHVLLLINKKNKYIELGMYDSNGKHKLNNIHKNMLSDESVNYGFLIKTINNPNGNGWNYMFNRKKFVNKIEKIFDVDLSEVNVESYPKD